MGEVIHVLEYAGMGGIFLGLIVIDGKVLRWLNTYSSFPRRRWFDRLTTLSKVEGESRRI